MDHYGIILTAFNGVLIVVVGYLIRHTLANIEHRIMRIENTFFRTPEA